MRQVLLLSPFTVTSKCLIIGGTWPFCLSVALGPSVPHCLSLFLSLLPTYTPLVNGKAGIWTQASSHSKSYSLDVNIRALTQKVIFKKQSNVFSTISHHHHHLPKGNTLVSGVPSTCTTFGTWGAWHNVQAPTRGNSPQTPPRGTAPSHLSLRCESSDSFSNITHEGCAVLGLSELEICTLSCMLVCLAVKARYRICVKMHTGICLDLILYAWLYLSVCLSCLSVHLSIYHLNLEFKAVLPSYLFCHLTRLLPLK